MIDQLTKAVEKILHIQTCAEEGRACDGDLDEVNRCLRLIEQQAEKTKDCVRKSLLEQGFYVKPGQMLVGFTKGGTMETITVCRPFQRD